MPGHGTRTAVLSAAAALALVGCGDLVLDAPSRSGLEPAPGVVSLDFGQVEVGKKATLVFELSNRGRGPVTFEPVPPEPPWSWNLAQESVEIQGGGPLADPVGLRIAFDFTPGTRAMGRYQGKAQLVGDLGTYVIQLEGRVIEDPILCSPSSPISFGHVVTGEMRREVVQCTNRSDRRRQIVVPKVIQQTGCCFAVDLDTEELVLPAYERREIPIRFVANVDTPVRAYLPIYAVGVDGGRELLIGGNGNGLELTGHAVPTHVVQLGDGSSNQTLDFGFVPVGDSAQLSLSLQNRYDRPVTISATWGDGGDDSDFEIVGLPETLEPIGDTADQGLLWVRFAPSTLGPRVHQLRVRVVRDDKPGLTEDVLALRGFGGGPEVSCKPGALSFGRVAVGSRVVGAIECRNVGDDLSVPEDDLEFVEVRVAGEVFHPRASLQDGGLRVEVDYLPIEPGLDVDELEVVTCAGAGCAASATVDGKQRITRIQLTGQPEHVPPEAYCDAVFEPAALDFGRLARDAGEARLTARLVNRGDHECLVSALDFLPGASPGFEVLDRPVSSWTLAPGEARSIPVVLGMDAPSDGEAMATAGVWISNPNQPRLELPIQALVGGSCLVLDPPAVDFTEGPERKVDPALACGAPDVAVKVRNHCGGAWQVTEIAPVVGSDPGFLSPASDALPISLSPETVHGFAVDFRPAAEGVFHGGIHVHAMGPNGETESLFLPVEGEAAAGGKWFDRFDLVTPKLDLLVVLSSSRVMYGKSIVSKLVEQQQIEAMVAALQRPDLDWQVGIISTDVATTGSASCPGGGTNGGEAGRLVPASGTGLRILTPGPGFETSFRANATSVRPCDVAERAFDATVLAISEPLASTTNRGLTREGGHLAVVFISAGDDASNRSASAVIDALAVRKASGLFSTWAILGNPILGCASPGAGSRYWEVAHLTTHLTGMVTRSACEPDTWQGLWEAIGDLASRSQSTFPLSAPTSAAAGAVQLTRIRPEGGSAWVPPSNAWRYEASRQTLEFNILLLQALFEDGGHIEVVYPLICDD